MNPGAICGLFISGEMRTRDWQALVQERAAENCAVIELDTVLSFYLSDQQFAVEVALIDEIAAFAASLGMKTSMYYPSLEIVTQDGETNPQSAGKVMAEWLQVGLNGNPNGKSSWTSLQYFF